MEEFIKNNSKLISKILESQNCGLKKLKNIQEFSDKLSLVKELTFNFGKSCMEGIYIDVYLKNRKSGLESLKEFLIENNLHKEEYRYFRESIVNEQNDYRLIINFDEPSELRVHFHNPK